MLNNTKSRAQSGEKEVPSPLSFPPVPYPSHLHVVWGSAVSFPAGYGAERMCVIFWAQKTHLVATKLPLRQTGMAVVRKKWQYGFKPAKELLVCQRPILSHFEHWLKACHYYTNIKCWPAEHKTICGRVLVDHEQSCATQLGSWFCCRSSV